MGNYTYTCMDCRSIAGSMVPVTPFEIWQLERYGNFIRESKSLSNVPGKTWIESQIEITEFNETFNG